MLALPPDRLVCVRPVLAMISLVNEHRVEIGTVPICRVLPMFRSTDNQGVAHLANSFLGMVHLATAKDWLKLVHAA